MAISVSFINMKGGVGKTTLAMQTALAADRMDYKVLAVDLDPQSNLSQAILGSKNYVKHLDENRPTVVQIFEGYMPANTKNPSPTAINIDDVILKSVSRYSKSTLDLIPSRLELSQTLRNPTGKERRLAKALSKVSDRYDLIIIDCAPTDSILTDAAYFASRYVLVPIKPEFMATIGLPLLAKSLQHFKSENEDHNIDICGIVFVHSSSYTSGPEGRRATADVSGVAAGEGWKIFDTHISYSTSYAKAARERDAVGTTSYARRATGANFTRYENEFFNAINLKEKNDE